MKRIMAFLLCVLLVFALAACGGNEENPSGSGSNTQGSSSTESPPQRTNRTYMRFGRGLWATGTQRRAGTLASICRTAIAPCSMTVYGAAVMQGKAVSPS